MEVFKEHINTIKSSGYEFLNPNLNLSEVFLKKT